MLELRLLACVSVLISALAATAAQVDPVATAVDALQRGDAKSAEASLRSELRAHPQNTDALSVLAVVLDQQKRFGEADDVYRRLVRLVPRSVPALNNYGNHLIASGKLDEARQAFLKVVALDPGHANANLQLSVLALKRSSPEEALRYVDRLAAPAQLSETASQVRMQALYLLHRDAEADPIFERLSSAAGRDPQRTYALGQSLAAAGKYDKAEETLSRALEASPGNLDILYHLGLAAAHAGHNERARDILRSVLQRQPDNVDALYDLAVVNVKMGQRESALESLAQAARVAPNRPDIQKLIAQTAAEMGFFRDATKAWDRYLKLVPGDDVARRERAFAQSADGEPTPESLSLVRTIVAKHPTDAVGHYEFGVMLAARSPDEALTEFNRALDINPDFIAARATRGRLHLTQGRFESALADFEAVLKANPNDALVLDRMGQTYLALDRPADAIPVLRRATELTPQDSRPWLHLGRALTESGQQDEARKALARVRELGPDKTADARAAGLVEFLSLSPEQQRAKYRAGVERSVQEDPRNPEAQVEYLKILLRERKTEQASEVARTILALPAKPALLTDAGNALLDADRNDLAKEFLQKAVSADPVHGPVIALALAILRSGDPQGALIEIDRTLEGQRSGDYFLARAQILQACGKTDEAAAALDRGIAADSTRADLYRNAVALLIHRNRAPDALKLLDRGVAVAPDNPNLALLRVVALTAAGNQEQAQNALKSLANRWPDAYRVWMANALFAKWQGRTNEARRMLETAVALGATDAQTRFTRGTQVAGLDAQGKSMQLLEALFP